MKISHQSKEEYISRLNKAIDYIIKNIDKQFTLDELASESCFSKFHFSRIFQSIIGESPFRFIQHIRLEKAAAMLIYNVKDSISNIADQCGFTDIAIFSRNFKHYFNLSATQYRNEKSNKSQMKSKEEQEQEIAMAYFCNELKTIKWRTEMKISKGIEVKELPKMTLAYLRNVGPYNGNQQLFQHLRNKLFSWAGARELFFEKDFKFLVLYHDDPNIAISDNLIMDLAITVPDKINVDGEIGKMVIEGGKYAVARFELTGKEFPDAWNWIFAQWLPVSGFQPDSKPCFEIYLQEPKEGNYLIEICVPVKLL